MCLYRTTTPEPAGAVLLTPAAQSAPPGQLYRRLVRARDDTPAAVAAAFNRSGLSVLIVPDEDTAAAIRVHTRRPVVTSLAAAACHGVPLAMPVSPGTGRASGTRGPAPAATASPLRWISRAQLSRDTQTLAGRLPWPVCGVAGVPRSGLLVAADIATRLAVPLYEARKTGELFPIDSGKRLKLGPRPPHAGRLVIVEDSVNTGASLKAVRDALRTLDPITAAVYVNPDCEFQPDITAVPLPMPHYFEWHFFGSTYVRVSGFDFDGILCEDFPGSGDDESDRYLKHLRDARPLWPVRPHQAALIVTARLEKFRPQTVAWLARHQIAVTRLVMGPWTSHAQRTKAYDAAKFKGQAFLRSRCRTFVESCPRQAAAIAKVARKPVICPRTGEVFTGS
jgi:uncharacterized HAD superfamily protein